MTPGAASLSVLYLGGTGTISAACVRASVAAGHDVTVVTRGGDAKGRGLPEGVAPLVADVADPDALRQALGDRSFDAVVDFLSFDAAGADRRVDVFAGRTRQFVAISSASIYRKPALQTPITESTLRANPFLAYARDKIAMEDAFLLHHSTSGFPVVIVRPSHTYDEASPPLAGDWTVVDRIARGEEVVVPGDGTSLWTLTHADDFAVGLVGILGDERATGEALHITSDDVMTWDRIHHLVADALGVEARIVHVPAEQFPVVEPDWGWSELVVGDLSHSAVFDTTRIRRLVPAFQPRIPFHLAVRGIVAWRAEHPELTRPDADTDRRIGRLVAAKHAADAAYRDAGAASGAAASGGAGA